MRFKRPLLKESFRMFSATATTLIAIATFAFIASISPGINTLMLVKSGSMFGIRKTLPMLVGCCMGLMIMVMIIAFGAGRLFELFPWFKQGLLYFCSPYLLYLVYHLSFKGRQASNNEAERNIAEHGPMSLVQAAMIQAINPGIWMLSIACLGLATHLVNDPATLTWVSLAVTLGNIPAMFLWLVGGSAISRFLTNDRNQRRFNTTLSAITLLTIPMLWISNS